MRRHDCTTLQQLSLQSNGSAVKKKPVYSKETDQERKDWILEEMGVDRLPTSEHSLLSLIQLSKGYHYKI